MQLTTLASIELVIWNIFEEYNVDPLPIFRKLQLDPSLMYQSGGRYPVSRVKELWTEATKNIKDPCFGLIAGNKWHPSNFGTLGYALLMSTSLRDTLLRLIKFNRVVIDEPVADANLTAIGDKLFYSLNYRSREAHHIPAREDSMMAWLLSMLQVNFQKPFAPVSVYFTHSKPKCAARYYELFQCPVFFDNSSTIMEISLDDANRILPMANKEMVAFNDQVMTKYLETKASSSLVSKVKKIIVEHLPSGNATLNKTASELFMSKRKLQRLLQKEGTSFFNLINDTRKDIAKQYVKNMDMDLTEIAFLLGFAEQSTFSRSFKRWTGKSPSIYRKTG